MWVVLDKKKTNCSPTVRRGKKILDCIHLSSVDQCFLLGGVKEGKGVHLLAISLSTVTPTLPLCVLYTNSQDAQHLITIPDDGRGQKKTENRN